ncbi:type IVB secretion system protein IcmH/DotU [Pseudoduganella namucuonensis]|uniref:Type VI secretion system protein ImpK n=1 Tax=Pseudoduganella namucuonensis TaxID=1035707 RepID=A0A1I7L4N3_9BURK|nr:type IVB secretion system protein IcmH/DotU [Pseudoduganella namucuonensis]SFV04689.1 type VI secretion system protein ImpK [Pseudoduganella namucuonensis]
MSQEDLPDSDRTILVPKPGGRRGAPSPVPGLGGADAAAPGGGGGYGGQAGAYGGPGGAAGPGADPLSQGLRGGAHPSGGVPGEGPAAPVTNYDAALAPLAAAPRAHLNGVNPLVGAANALLDLVVPLRIMATHPNVEGLRGQLVSAIKKFEVDAKAAGCSQEAIAVARYSLCTFLDETISSTPWGGGGVWASRSLLVAFHNEAFGGEKFFIILQKLCQQPQANLHVLELMYLCLALGLEGRYRVIDGGRGQLDLLRERLQQLIQKERGPLEPALSLRWRGSNEKRPGLMRLIPVWVMAAIAGLVLLLLHLGLNFVLNRQSDPVFAALQRIRLVAPAPPPPPMANPPVRVAKFLAPEIEQGLVSVTETPDRSTIVLHGDGVFKSGSAEAERSYEPLLKRIGEALKPVPGKVIVIGHTDDVPSTSARFPSNWALSKGRAATVARTLAEQAGPAARYSAEGRGETEPLVPNDSSANRARNRRVVIIVLTPAAP